jgi:hypothetical protein
MKQIFDYLSLDCILNLKMSTTSQIMSALELISNLES